MKAILMTLLLIPVVTLGAIASGIPAMDKVIDWIGMINTPAWTAIISAGLEICLRRWPSQKSLSLLMLLSVACHGLGKIFDGLSVLLDKVVPQNITAVVAPKSP